MVERKTETKFPLYSECEKKRVFDKSHFIEELPQYIKKPFPISFFMSLLEIEEKLQKNSKNVEILNQALEAYSVE